MSFLFLVVITWAYTQTVCFSDSSIGEEFEALLSWKCSSTLRMRLGVVFQYSASSIWSWEQGLSSP